MVFGYGDREDVSEVGLVGLAEVLLERGRVWFTIIHRMRREVLFRLMSLLARTKEISRIITIVTGSLELRGVWLLAFASLKIGRCKHLAGFIEKYVTYRRYETISPKPQNSIFHLSILH